MGTAKTYRWERRRRKQADKQKFAFLDIYDLVILILVFAMSFISLRLLFTFEVIQAPCTEMLMTWGQVNGNWPVFKICFVISLLIGLYWLCVTLSRILAGKSGWRLISWHIVMFITIFFLALFNRAVTSGEPITPPDGTMVVEYLVPKETSQGTEWVSYDEPHFREVKNGVWYAGGNQACVWLDENKITYADHERQNYEVPMKHKLGLGISHFEILQSIQRYRPLLENERDRFLEKKACQANITNYGKPREICGPDYLYPLPAGVKPDQKLYEYGTFNVP